MDLNTPLSAEEITQVIGYMNFHYGIDEYVVRAMVGTPGLIPAVFLEAYDPDSKPSNEAVNEFLGEINKEDVGDFLDAVAKISPIETGFIVNKIGLSDTTDYQLFGEAINFTINTRDDGPITINSPVVSSIASTKPALQVLRLNKKFKGK